MKIKTVLAMLLTASSLQACAIERHDVIECELPDGSKFVLKAAYDWTPLARLIPADVAERVNQEDFKVSYLHDHINLEIENINAPHSEFHSDPSGNSTCQDFGKLGAVAYFGRFAPVLITQDNQPEINVTSWDEKLNIFGSSSKAKSEPIRRYRLNIEQMNLSRTIIAASVIDKKIYWEVALIEKSCRTSGRYQNCPPVAVFQSTSLDHGKTWRNPVITTDAKIFELGRSLREQSFIARPIRINGKKVEAHFPQPQTPEERKRFLETQPKL